MSGNRAGRENVFAVCDVIPSEISETHMKKALISKEKLPQLMEPMQAEVLLSEELLARKLADDFCEFGSSETIGRALPRMSRRPVPQLGFARRGPGATMR
jgi:hypothetical protein